MHWFFIPLLQIGLAVKGPFTKQYVANSSFHLVKYIYCIITVYFLPGYKLATNLTKEVLFHEVLSGIWEKKYFSFFKVNSLSSTKA